MNTKKYTKSNHEQKKKHTKKNRNNVVLLNTTANTEKVMVHIYKKTRQIRLPFFHHGVQKNLENQRSHMKAMIVDNSSPGTLGVPRWCSIFNFNKQERPNKFFSFLPSFLHLAKFHWFSDIIFSRR